MQAKDLKELQEAVPELFMLERAIFALRESITQLNNAMWVEIELDEGDEILPMVRKSLADLNIALVGMTGWKDALQEAISDEWPSPPTSDELRKDWEEGRPIDK